MFRFQDLSQSHPLSAQCKGDAPELRHHDPDHAQKNNEPLNAQVGGDFQVQVMGILVAIEPRDPGRRERGHTNPQWVFQENRQRILQDDNPGLRGMSFLFLSPDTLESFDILIRNDGEENCADNQEPHQETVFPG